MKRRRWIYLAAAAWLALGGVGGTEITAVRAAESARSSQEGAAGTEDMVKASSERASVEVPSVEDTAAAESVQSQPEAVPMAEAAVNEPGMAPTEGPGTSNPEAAPEPSTVAPEPTPEPSTSAPDPEPSTSAPTPEPTAPEPTPEPSTSAPDPEPSTPEPTPGPSTVTPTPGPSTPTPTPEPSTPTPDPEPSTQAPTPEPPATDPAPSEPATDLPQSSTVHLGLDNKHAYSGMSQSFANGYEPKVTVGSATLVVPFTSSGALKDDCLTVDLDFGETSTAPFQFKNYQKDVDKKTYYFDKKGVYTKDKSKASSSQEAYLYRCKLLFLEDAAPGQYPVTVKAWGYTEKGEKASLDYRLFIRIPEADQDDVIDIGSDDGGSAGGGGYGGGYSGESETEAVIHQPKMLLESCSLSGKELEAGTKEEMELSFKNRSDEQTMYNLKITLSTQSQGLKLQKNSYYFSRVSPGEEVFLENQVDVSRDAAASDIPLTFTFEYEDSKGTPSTGTEQVNLVVTQPVRMEIETADIPTALYASDTVELSIKALNLSRTTVYNVRVNLFGTGLFPREDLFLGNMEAGTSGEDTMSIYVGTRTMTAIGEDSGTDDGEKYGPVSGTITLTYEDALGNPYEVTKDYQTEIKKAEILSLKVTEEEPETNSWWYSVFAVLIAAMVLLILILLWRLRRNHVLLKEARGER